MKEVPENTFNLISFPIHISLLSNFYQIFNLSLTWWEKWSTQYMSPIPVNRKKILGTGSGVKNTNNYSLGNFSLSQSQTTSSSKHPSGYTLALSSLTAFQEQVNVTVVEDGKISLFF